MIKDKDQHYKAELQNNFRVLSRNLDLIDIDAIVYSYDEIAYVAKFSLCLTNTFICKKFETKSCYSIPKSPKRHNSTQKASK